LPHPALGQDFTLTRATPSAVSEHVSELLGFPISWSGRSPRLPGGFGGVSPAMNRSAASIGQSLYALSPCRIDLAKARIALRATNASAGMRSLRGRHPSYRACESEKSTGSGRRRHRTLKLAQTHYSDPRRRLFGFRPESRRQASRRFPQALHPLRPKMGRPSIYCSSMTSAPR
jgi:hypothetical protein